MTNEKRRNESRGDSRAEIRRERLGRRKRARKKAMVLAGALAALIFVLGFITGMVTPKNFDFGEEEDEERVQAEIVSSEAERLNGIKLAFSLGESVLQTFRKYYPDDIVLANSNNKSFTFEPIDRSLRMHSFDPEKVRKNTDGTWGYVDGDLKAEKGIDVSSHQGEIDWGKVAESNVQFAMIRAMYRGYESGKLVEDKEFRNNIEGAHRVGIKTGVYVFTQAISKEEVDQEVSMLCGLLGAYDIEMPVVVDVEAIADDEARMDSLTKEERTELVKYYCEKIDESGYKPMIYFNIRGAVSLLDQSQLEAFDKWFAVYDSDFYYPYAYQMWQYKDTGRVPGIETNVDFDLYFPEL